MRPCLASDSFSQFCRRLEELAVPVGGPPPAVLQQLRRHGDALRVTGHRQQRQPGLRAQQQQVTHPATGDAPAVFVLEPLQLFEFGPQAPASLGTIGSSSISSSSSLDSALSGSRYHFVFGLAAASPASHGSCVSPIVDRASFAYEVLDCQQLTSRPAAAVAARAVSAASGVTAASPGACSRPGHQSHRPHAVT